MLKRNRSIVSVLTLILLLLSQALCTDSVQVPGSMEQKPVALPKPTQLELQTLNVKLKDYRKDVLIGSALFATGALINYAIIIPQSFKIDPRNTGDVLALLSPQMLSFGLKTAGTVASFKRYNQASRLHSQTTGSDGDRTLVWTGFFAGIGFFGAANALQSYGSMQGDERFVYGGYVFHALHDLAWGFTNAYSWLKVGKLQVGDMHASARIMPALSHSPSVTLVVDF
ncbi:MAG: hypothetical protein GF398_01705 [Chitinivibrionales bacterium]|nr:hypothetical protein [Chitinivibrionales bacterium]